MVNCHHATALTQMLREVTLVGSVDNRVASPRMHILLNVMNRIHVCIFIKIHTVIDKIATRISRKLNWWSLSYSHLKVSCCCSATCRNNLKCHLWMKIRWNILNQGHFCSYTSLFGWCDLWYNSHMVAPKTNHFFFDTHTSQISLKSVTDKKVSSFLVILSLPHQGNRPNWLSLL